MNGTSGFQEVRSSTSRYHRLASYTSNGIDLGIGFWHLLRAHNLIACSRGISTKRKMFPANATNSLGSYNKGVKLLCFMASVWVF